MWLGVSDCKNRKCFDEMIMLKLVNGDSYRKWSKSLQIHENLTLEKDIVKYWGRLSQ